MKICRRYPIPNAFSWDLARVILWALLATARPTSAATGGALDPSFHNGFEFHDSVYKIALQKDGKIVATTVFQTYDDKDVPSIIRLHPDGTLDPSFKYNGLEYYAGAASALVLDSKDRILVMGTFSDANFNDYTRLIRLKSDGTLSKILATQSSDDSLYDLLLVEDGSIVVAGEFSRFKGAARNALARILPDDSLDPVFDPGKNYSNRDVEALLALPGGDFLASPVQWTPRADPSDGVVRLRSDGSLNPILPYFPSGFARPLLKWDGRILLGGFSSPGIRSIREDGYSMPCFGEGLERYPYILATISDGRIIAYYRRTSDHTEVQRLFADGTKDPSFKFDAYDGDIESFQETPDGAYLFSGYFQFINGEVSPGLAKILSGNEGAPEQIRFNGVKFGALDDEASVRVPLLRTGDASKARDVQVTTLTGGTAIEGVNYRLTNGTVHFAVGQRLASIGIELIPGDVGLSQRTIPLVLSGTGVRAEGSAAEVCIGATIGTIEFSTNRYEFTEGSGNSYLALTRQGGTLGEISQAISVRMDSTFTSDLTTPISSAYFSAGSTLGNAMFRINDNSIVDGTRLIEIALTNLAVSYRAGVIDKAIVSILDNDLPGSPGETYGGLGAQLWPTMDNGILISGSFTNWFGQTRIGMAKLNADGTLGRLFEDEPIHLARILDAHADGRIAVEISTNQFNSRIFFGDEKSTILQIRNSDGSILGAYHGTNRLLGVGLLDQGRYYRVSGRREAPFSNPDYWYNIELHSDSGAIITNHVTKVHRATGDDVSRTPIVGFSWSSDGAGYLTGDVALTISSSLETKMFVRFNSQLQFDTTFQTPFYTLDVLRGEGRNLPKCWPVSGGRLLVLKQASD